MNAYEIVDKLNAEKLLSQMEWTALLRAYTPELAEYAAALARQTAHQHFGNKIFVRGIIEYSNICGNDCFYCGIRKSNTNVHRYNLTPETILDCCQSAYDYGFRTFVLQSGERVHFDCERLAGLLRNIKARFPDCAITLSLGELSEDIYQKLFDAGADRYLLRHETADELHYRKLHPEYMSLSNRLECLHTLKRIGYQTGCGMMIGSPFQTVEHLAKDMLFIQDFQPQMVGMGPFIPHNETPFANYPAGSVEQTLFLLSLTRILLPEVLLPATTALGSLAPDGRERGVLSGANVIMPNLSPEVVQKDYRLYNHKRSENPDAHIAASDLQKRLQAIGYEIAVTRGDHGEKIC